MSRTPYFTPQTFRFLRDIVRHNERAWFADNRDRYEQHVRDPMLRLITDLQGPLAAISTHYRADPRGQGGSLFRIHRDTRFRNDKTPYKTWAGARLFHERRKQVATPSFYIHVQPGHCFVGAGIWHPQPKELKRVRDFLVDNPVAWTRATQAPAFRRRYELGGEMLTRPPRGYDREHPLIEDLKRKSFVVSRIFDDELACSPRLLQSIERDLVAMAPFVDYLCAALDLEF